ncbi:MAG: hypothetical protein QOI16_2662 [Pseudonocardiales bacterium]|jgi:hypothetical protein|nr:hypothetical protein [Pseudonocardiales bacterium]
MVLERLVEGPAAVRGSFMIPGDSMIISLLHDLLRMAQGAGARAPDQTAELVVLTAQSGGLSVVLALILFTTRWTKVPSERASSLASGLGTRPRLLTLGENAVSLFKYVVAAAAGYYLGQPHGRRLVQRLRQEATELVHSPRATQLKERGWDIAGDRASGAVKLVRRKRTNASTGAPDPDGGSAASDQPADAVAGAGTETGFGGRTVAEDTQAVRTGITPPAPAGRTTDADSTDAL